MKTKLTLAALIAFAAVANATPGQVSPVTTPKTKHPVHFSSGAESHAASSSHSGGHYISAPIRTQRASLTHPSTAPGPK